MAEVVSKDGKTYHNYQQVAEDFLVDKRQGRGATWAEPGLGKTAVAGRAAKRLSPDKPVLVTCRNVGIRTWRYELRNWLVGDSVVYAGSAVEREAAWKEWRKGNTQFLIVPHSQLDELVCRPRGAYWETVVFDEAHNLRVHHGHLSTSNTKLFKAIRKTAYHNFLELTGDPMVNRPTDYWGQLFFLCRDYKSEINTYHKWIEKWMDVVPSEYGGDYSVDIEGVKDWSKFNRMVDRYGLRQLQEDHLPELGPLTRVAIPIVMKKRQKKLYEQMAKDMLMQWEDNVVLTPNRISQIMRLRQILVNPALLGGPDESSQLEALAEHIKDCPHPIAINTPFTSAMPTITDYVARGGFTTQYVMKGGMTYQKIGKVEEEFHDNQDPRRALLFNTSMGESFQAASASRIYSVGFDWTPKNHRQSEKRLHRPGQTRFVLSYYFVHEGTIDEHLLSVLERKTTWQQLASGDPLEMLLPRG